MPLITHVLDNFDIGGAQRMLVRFLANSDPEESGVISMSRRGTAWEDDVVASSIEIDFLPSSRLGSLATWRSALRALRASPSKIVHVHMQYSSIVFLPLAKLAGRKTAVTLHNVGDSVDTWRQRARSRLHRFAIRRFADRVISVGPLVTESWQMHLPGKQICTIENTVPSPKPASPDIRRALRDDIEPGGAKCVVVIAVASLLPKKDLARLVSAFRLVAAECENARLWIVGTGPQRDALERQIEESHLRGRAKLLGARTDVQDLLQASDIFSLSSKIEGLPISMLEAMACELPVVAPSVGDIPTVVGEECGIVVPPADTAALASALTTLVRDETLRKRLGRAGRLKIERDHSENRWLDELRSIYRSLLDDDASRTSPRQ